MPDVHHPSRRQTQYHTLYRSTMRFLCAIGTGAAMLLCLRTPETLLALVATAQFGLACLYAAYHRNRSIHDTRYVRRLYHDGITRVFWAQIALASANILFAYQLSDTLVDDVPHGTIIVASIWCVAAVYLLYALVRFAHVPPSRTD